MQHILIIALSDDQDIMKQTRSLYARANVIIRKFSHASLNKNLCYSELIDEPTFQFIHTMDLFVV